MPAGYFFEDLPIGQTASLGETITATDILLDAAVSADANPTHIDAEAAKHSILGERIAHGTLSAGLISADLGTRLPGPRSLYTLYQRAGRPSSLAPTATRHVTPKKKKISDDPSR